VDVLRDGTWYAAKVRSVNDDGSVNVSWTTSGRAKSMTVAKGELLSVLAASGSMTEGAGTGSGTGSGAGSGSGSVSGSVSGSGSASDSGPLARSVAAVGAPVASFARRVSQPRHAAAPVAAPVAEVAGSSASSGAGPLAPLAPLASGGRRGAGAPPPAPPPAVDVLDVLDKSQPLGKHDPYEQAALGPGAAPPAPSGGWRWRPAEVDQSSGLRGGDEIQVLFLDCAQLPAGLPHAYPTRLSESAPYGSKSGPSVQHHSLQPGDVVDVLDRFRKKGSKGEWGEKWRKCQVTHATAYFVRVTYVGWSKAFDEWIHVLQQAERLSEFGSRTEQALRAREGLDARFARAMQKARGLTVAPMEPDGNCLFRAVAHQVYGDAERHDIVRSDCCDYLDKNRERFEPLLEPGQFDAYVANKRQLKVWGDDPEVRAMEELYDRPMEVFLVAGDGTRTEPLKVHFDGDLPPDLQGPCEPIRLSFHGDNHYNSVIKHVLAKDGKDVSSQAWQPPPMRTDGVIRKHRRARHSLPRGLGKPPSAAILEAQDEAKATSS
jgi:hypothetical protein